MSDFSAASFQFFYNEETPISMYPGLLLFFGLNGSSMLDTVEKSHVLQKNEIYIASPLTLYRVRCKEDAVLLSMAISPEIIEESGWEEKMTAYCLLPAAEANDAAHYAVRQGMAALFRSLFQAGSSSSETNRQAIRLASVVRQDFAQKDGKYHAPNAEVMTRIEQVLRYVQTRWNEPVTLAQVAAEQFLSESYLSRIFRRHLNMTFGDYVVSVRLEHAEADLRKTGDSVTRIAYRNGFRSTNAFIEYFRRRYGTTPGKYRKSMAGEQKITGTTTARDLSDYIQTLLQYDDTPDELAAAQPARIYRATVDTTRQWLPAVEPPSEYRLCA